MNDYPLKKVIKTVELHNKYCRPGEGSRRHFLECGHSVAAKQSGGIRDENGVQSAFNQNKHKETQANGQLSRTSKTRARRSHEAAMMMRQPLPRRMDKALKGSR